METFNAQSKTLSQWGIKNHQNSGIDYPHSKRGSSSIGSIPEHLPSSGFRVAGEGAIQQGERVGGVLNALKESKEAHLRYVRAHSERLKKRLKEDESEEKKLLADIEAIEQQLQEVDAE